MAAPRPRTLSSSTTAIASFARAVDPRSGDQPQDGGEVAQTRLPDVEGAKPGAKSSNATRLGSFILISQRFRQLKYEEGQKTVRGAVFLNGGQVERMIRTIKDATVKRFHNDSHDQLRTHLAAYNFARRLKTLNGLTPDEYICKIRTSEPDRFILNPIHQMPGLNT